LDFGFGGRIFKFQFITKPGSLAATLKDTAFLLKIPFMTEPTFTEKLKRVYDKLDRLSHRKKSDFA